MSRRKRMLEELLDHFCTVQWECPMAEIQTARYKRSLAPLVPSASNCATNSP
jgi:hypothetical protein